MFLFYPNPHSISSHKKTTIMENESNKTELQKMLEKAFAFVDDTLFCNRTTCKGHHPLDIDICSGPYFIENQIVYDVKTPCGTGIATVLHCEHPDDF